MKVAGAVLAFLAMAWWKTIISPLITWWRDEKAKKSREDQNEIIKH